MRHVVPLILAMLCACSSQQDRVRTEAEARTLATEVLRARGDFGPLDIRREDEVWVARATQKNPNPGEPWVVSIDAASGETHVDRMRVINPAYQGIP
ncbi:hypothetical protein [Phenylobacterium sp.]|jgi:microcystin degradation protein MlrC|uniref:hypothetical protein n=1 Tax=Phenylobacterium sp. TaxID=1871053 RepID=UPI002F93C946